ncbi:hypothetical protein ACOSQ3_032355 [Xanthoceras sorbifolium]
MDRPVVSAPMIENDHLRHQEETSRHGLTTQQKPYKKGGWNSAIFIIFMEMAERFAYQGLASNLITYLTNVLHEPMGTAAKNVNTWTGISNIFPVLGAYIADSFLGRFKTILFAAVIFFMGMVLLTLAVSVVPLHYREALFFISLYILTVGEGGHKPCVQTFAADQFDESNPKERQAKTSFFNWWYLGIVFGGTAAMGVVYIQDNVGWGVGFGILAGANAFALALFMIGIKRFRKKSPVGSPFTTVMQVIVAAARKWRVTDTRGGHGIFYDSEYLGQISARTNQLRFLDKAMIMDDVDCSNITRNPWRLCSLNQVEEVKLVIRLIPIWLSCLMFSAILVLVNTFYIKQGSTMIRSIGPNFEMPPAGLLTLTGLTILITVFVYDRILVPLARKFTGLPSGISTLQRIGIGLFLSILNMSVAGLVEVKRIKIAREHGLLDSPQAIVPMRIWWLLPQYIISGIADVFTIVGLQEFFYYQVPEPMRSMGAAAYLSVTGAGSFVNSAIISIVQAITSINGGEVWLGDNINRAHLHHFYWLLAGLSALNLCVFVWIAKGFVYKTFVEDDMKEETGQSYDSY